MGRFRSVRAFFVVAIIAMMLAIITPFLAMTHMGGQVEESPVAPSASAVMDCIVCPKANMAPAGCMQASCQVTAIEVEFVHPPVTGPTRYRLATMARPDEWHTVPPVSPG